MTCLESLHLHPRNRFVMPLFGCPSRCLKHYMLYLLIFCFTYIFVAFNTLPLLLEYHKGRLVPLLLQQSLKISNGELFVLNRIIINFLQAKYMCNYVFPPFYDTMLHRAESMVLLCQVIKSSCPSVMSICNVDVEVLWSYSLGYFEYSVLFSAQIC